MAIQVIIAGMGPRGRDWVREVQSSTAFELAACVDTDGQVLQQAAVGLKIPRRSCFTDLVEALSKTPCQAAIIATSPENHAQASETALLNGIAVLVEKPFTLHLREAVRLVELAEQKKTPLLVAQNYRYLRSFRGVRHVIDQGTLGRINFITCQYFRPPHEMAPSLRRLPHSVLFGMAVHHLDALRYVLGQPVRSVSAASFARDAGNAPDGASFQALLLFADGTRGSYSATYESSGHQYFERGQEFYARFVGERGTLHVFHRWLVLCQSGKLPRLVRRGTRDRTEEQVLLQQLERAILHDETAEVSGRDNLHTMALLEACVQSSDERRWINPEDLLNESAYGHAPAGDRG
jgi:predicted dehydrogenase